MTVDPESQQPQNTTELLPLFLPPSVSIPLGSLIGVCVMVGVPVKFVFFRYLGSAPKRLFGAINRMIFFEQARKCLPSDLYYIISRISFPPHK